MRILPLVYGEGGIMGRRIFCFALPLLFIALLFVSCSDKADDMLVDLDINISVNEPRFIIIGS